MPDIKIENLEKTQVRITFTLTPDEIRPHLEEAAKRLSESSTIPGFRPGKASYAIVEQRFGDMKILEEAIEPIVRSQYVQALLSNNIETVGSPKIDVEKLAPGNDLVFTAEVTRMPRTRELADYTTLTIQKKPVEVKDKELDLALRDLQRMQTKEVRAKEGTAVTEKDKVVVSMTIKKDGMAIEGGASPNHAIYLTEDYYIPGLKEQIIGLKEGEEKSFTLPFPKEHVQKMLAGNDAQFEVKVKELFHLTVPALDDAFAATLGMKDMAALRDAIHRNLQEEKATEEQARQEREMLELLAGKSRFEDIPDILLNEEINKMIAELKRGVESEGLEFETYLSNLKRTLAQLKIDFTPKALLRVKVALVLRAVGEKEKVLVDEKETDEELDRIAAHYEDKEAKEQIYSPAYREYAEQVMKNRKIIDLLKAKMIPSP